MFSRKGEKLEKILPGREDEEFSSGILSVLGIVDLDSLSMTVFTSESEASIGDFRDMSHDDFKIKFEFDGTVLKAVSSSDQIFFLIFIDFICSAPSLKIPEEKN